MNVVDREKDQLDSWTVQKKPVKETRRIDSKIKEKPSVREEESVIKFAKFCSQNKMRMES